MDKLVMTIAATANETRILLTQGPDEVLKARLRAVATPAHRFAGPMLCEAMALWHDQRIHAVVSAESEDILFALGLCDGLGVAHCTLHYVVHPLPENGARRGRRLAGLGDFAREHRLCRSVGR
jgi:hypothetical protein